MDQSVVRETTYSRETAPPETVRISTINLLPINIFADNRRALNGGRGYVSPARSFDINVDKPECKFLDTVRLAHSFERIHIYKLIA